MLYQGEQEQVKVELVGLRGGRTLKFNQNKINYTQVPTNSNRKYILISFLSTTTRALLVRWPLLMLGNITNNRDVYSDQPSVTAALLVNSDKVGSVGGMMWQ